MTTFEGSQLAKWVPVHRAGIFSWIGGSPYTAPVFFLGSVFFLGLAQPIRALDLFVYPCVPPDENIKKCLPDCLPTQMARYKIRLIARATHRFKKTSAYEQNDPAFRSQQSEAPPRPSSFIPKKRSKKYGDT